MLPFPRLAAAATLVALLAACDAKTLQGLAGAIINDGRPGTSTGSTSPTANASAKPEGPVDQALVTTAKTRFTQEGKDPEAALRLWFDALILYVNEPTRSTGRVLMNAFTAYELWETGSSSAFFLDRIKTAPYTFYSYYKGTSPENGYTLPSPPELNVTRHDPGTGGTYKIFVTSSGADFPRPVSLKLGDDGLYRANEFSSVYVSIRAPK